MPRLVGLSRRVWQPGEYERGYDDAPFSIPVGLSQLWLMAERNNWPVLPGGVPENQVLRVQIELSMDNGVTWGESLTIPDPNTPGARIVTPTRLKFGTPGGVRIDIRGDEVTHAVVGPILLPQPTNPNRVARVELDIQVRLRTQIDVDVL